MKPLAILALALGVCLPAMAQDKWWAENQRDGNAEKTAASVAKDAQPDTCISLIAASAVSAYDANVDKQAEECLVNDSRREVRINAFNVHQSEIYFWVYPLSAATCERFKGTLGPNGSLTGAAIDALIGASADDLQGLLNLGAQCALYGPPEIHWAAFQSAEIVFTDSIMRAQKKTSGFKSFVKAWAELAASRPRAPSPLANSPAPALPPPPVHCYGTTTNLGGGLSATNATCQ